MSVSIRPADYQIVVSSTTEGSSGGRPGADHLFGDRAVSGPRRTCTDGGAHLSGAVRGAGGRTAALARRLRTAPGRGRGAGEARVAPCRGVARPLGRREADRA